MNLDKEVGGPEFGKVVDALAADDKSRTDFLKACLSKLGLQVTQDTTTVPSLSSLHLSASDSSGPSRLVSSLEGIVRNEQGEYLKDENDTFRIHRPGAWNMDKLTDSLPDNDHLTDTSETEGIVDYNAIEKRLVVHDELPSSKITPYFNHHAFYSNLKEYRSRSKEGADEFGSNLLYGEVITSTNTILEK